MNSNEYNIRRAKSQEDGTKLNNLFTKVFQSEEEGILAETIFNHHPESKFKYWFIAEHKKTGELVSAFTLIPWTWEIEGTTLKVAEMGIVGTLEEHRGKGLIKALNVEFEETLKEEEFDLAAIQGIPGFYHKLGYHYAIPLDNFINVPFHVLNNVPKDLTFSFRLANKNDIPFLIQQDADYRKTYSISVNRNKYTWEYLLKYSIKTAYGSEFWIMEKGEEKYYFRIPAHGFGEGLIVSEISETISTSGMMDLLTFCKQNAIEREKPSIRLNISFDTTPGKIAQSLGAEKGNFYAWQMKIPNEIRLLKTISPVLEKRIAGSPFRGFSETLIIDHYNRRFSIRWTDGKIKTIEPSAKDEESRYTISINNHQFAALCLGHKSWQELGDMSPDVYFLNSGETRVLIETLFPKTVSWIHEQY